MATCHFKMGVPHSQALPLILGKGCRCSAAHHQVGPEPVRADVLQAAICRPSLGLLCAQAAVEIVQAGLVDEQHLCFIGKACNQQSRYRQRLTPSLTLMRQRSRILMCKIAIEMYIYRYWRGSRQSRQRHPGRSGAGASAQSNGCQPAAAPECNAGPPLD